MNRRSFLKAALSSSVPPLLAAPFLTGCSLVPTATQAATTASPTSPAISTASVNLSQLTQFIEQQQCAEWCWAACISMIFSFYGHPVSQQHIVDRTYGSPICNSAQTLTIGIDLDMPWIDDNKVPFVSQIISAYDPANNVFSLNNAILISELSSNHPMLYCNTQHAEVLYSVEYQGTPAIPNILEASVIDPWPSNPRSHPLTPAELVPSYYGGEMNFLAAIRVM